MTSLLVAHLSLSLLPSGSSPSAHCAADGRIASRAGRLSRRSLCTTLFGLPAAATAETWLPKPLADARRKAEEKEKLKPQLVYDPDKITILVQPTSDFLFILNAKRELDAVATKVGAPAYKPNDEDRIAIFQLLGFSFRPTGKLMDKMLTLSPSAPLAAQHGARGIGFAPQSRS